jgi:hypothetical protein
MTEKRTGHVHRATVKPLSKSKKGFWGPTYFSSGSFFAREPPPPVQVGVGVEVKWTSVGTYAGGTTLRIDGYTDGLVLAPSSGG